jgi:hypothetical protein
MRLLVRKDEPLCLLLYPYSAILTDLCQLRSGRRRVHGGLSGSQSRFPDGLSANTATLFHDS